MKARPIFLITFIVSAIVLIGLVFSTVLSHDGRNQRRSAPRSEQVYERPAPPPEAPPAEAKQSKDGAEYYRLKTGTGINTELLVYEGKKYILVYNTNGGGMAIIEHKSP